MYVLINKSFDDSTIRTILSNHQRKLCVIIKCENLY